MLCSGICIFRHHQLGDYVYVRLQDNFVIVRQEWTYAVRRGRRLLSASHDFLSTTLATCHVHATRSVSPATLTYPTRLGQGQCVFLAYYAESVLVTLTLLLLYIYTIIIRDRFKVYRYFTNTYGTDANVYREQGGGCRSHFYGFVISVPRRAYLVASPGSTDSCFYFNKHPIRRTEGKAEPMDRSLAPLESILLSTTRPCVSHA